jgi:hypothetical protein
MGLLGSSGGYPVASVTDDLLTHVDAATAPITPATQADSLGDGERALVHVRPYADSDGFESAVEFARALYQSPSAATGGQSVEALEWWFSGGQLGQRFCTTTPGEFDQDVSSHYANSSVHTPDRTFLDLQSDEYVACVRFHLQQDCAFPIAHQNTRLDALATDPYKQLASALVGPDDTRALVQCVFSPVDKHTWYQRGLLASLRSNDVDDMAERRKEGKVKGQINPTIVESAADKKAAKDMQRQVGRPAFQTAVRMVVTAPTKHAVQERMADLVGAVEEFDYSTTEQAFYAEPLSGRALIDGIAAAAGRELFTQGRLKRTLFGRERVLTDEELAGLVHLPNREINAPLLDWERMESGAGTPGAKGQFASKPPDPSAAPAQPTAAPTESQPVDGASPSAESGQQQPQHASQAESGMETVPADERATDAESAEYAEQKGGSEDV